jgi:hypothetical protein
MFGIILSGRYWTWEKITMAFCLVNLIYIPAAFLVHPSVADVSGPASSPTSRVASTGHSSSL